MVIRWLHLSDVHENTREVHSRRRMYAEIVEEVRRRPAPNLVFFTGDFAFAGAREEYETLENDFIGPLKEVLPNDCRLFSVPGNHDVERSRTIDPRVWACSGKDAEAFQALEPSGAAKRKDMLLPRFAAYAEFDRRVSSWGSNWLESDAGAVWWTDTINGAQIAVVGVNTAWLCQDEEDWGKLTPGRNMLQGALDEAEKQRPDLLIVLGHHPLDALAGEGDQPDGPRVRERLKQAKALYLHGHLHASDSDRIGDALRSTLTIQAPSAFQAHDNPRWRNGLMWGEADLSTGWLIIEPRLWNEDKREYKWDVDCGYEADRAPGRDGLRLRLPSVGVIDPTSSGEPAPEPKPSIELPQGWQVIDKSALAEIRAQPPTTATMIGFFDGLLPTWPLVLADGVRPRAAAERLAARLQSVYMAAPKPAVVLLAGPGGEGKSTALLHAAAALVEDERQAWTCLHRFASSPATPLPEYLLARLPVIPDHAWVVVIDDADTVGPAILAALKRLAPRTDVHLLLAARDAEWRAKRLVPGFWEDFADFREEPLAGLEESDARRIIDGWCAWGDEAMGRVRGWSADQASAVLLGHACDLAARREEGSLLGALLITRQGEDMRAHVRTLLHGLGRDPVVGRFSRHDIYCMIAAMHAENQLYLSRSVLAYATGCEPEELERKALDVLRREAMVDSGEISVLTRHRRIDEAACSALRDDGDDVDRWYPLLGRAALQHFLAKRPTPEIANWCNRLPKHFVDKGDRWWPVARSTAKALYDANSADGHLLTSYSSVLRRTGRAADAIDLLKATGERFRSRRDVLYEWGTVAGRVGDKGLATWLGGRSLADDGAIDPRQCKLSLAGLGVAFRELFVATGNPIFSAGQAACGQLGLHLPELDATARGYFKKYAADGHRNGVPEFSPEQAVEAIRKAVVLGAEEVEQKNDPVFFENILGDPEVYSYTALLRTAGGGAERRQ